MVGHTVGFPSGSLRECQPLSPQKVKLDSSFLGGGTTYLMISSHHSKPSPKHIRTYSLIYYLLLLLCISYLCCGSRIHYALQLVIQ